MDVNQSKSKIIVQNIPQIIKLNDIITLIIKDTEIEINNASSLKIIKDTTPSDQYIIQSNEQPPRISSYPISVSPYLEFGLNPELTFVAPSSSSSSNYEIQSILDSTQEKLKKRMIDINKSKEIEKEKKCAFRKKRLINEIKIVNNKLKKIQIIDSSDNYDILTFIINDDDVSNEVVTGTIMFDEFYPYDESWKYKLKGEIEYYSIKSSNSDKSMKTLLEDRLNYICKYKKQKAVFSAFIDKSNSSNKKRKFDEK